MQSSLKYICMYINWPRKYGDLDNEDTYGCSQRVHSTQVPLYYYTTVRTHHAVKAFWVPCVVQGSDKALHGGSLAAIALGSKLLIVVLPAVCLPVLFVEPLITKMLATQRTEEMLRMPCLAQCIHTMLWGRDRIVIHTLNIHSRQILLNTTLYILRMCRPITNIMYHHYNIWFTVVVTCIWYITSW